ncbi:hypothetical protein MKJ04_19105 [Pontibacter sp. E15-1]|uniref:hypothetical protein n=1 Tax=Pontibacter sp. E15-1 TaxID=2919918 RepID=UPI001F4FA357|nr:hypothetical protein [Pontibacter sp. E15-1]MCJ8166958.1 hypothetical protein [Pontibacter sp. E15-1]
MNRYIVPLLVLLALASGCSDSDDKFNEKLMAAVTEGEVGPQGFKTIQLADLTDFDWETMYYFQPNEDYKAISHAIGFKWTGDPVKHGYRRLLFVKGEQVVSYTDYDYEELPLFVYGCQDDKWVYPKGRAEFASFKYCSGTDSSAVYAFIPVRCIGNIQELMENTCPEGTEAE